MASNYAAGGQQGEGLSDKLRQDLGNKVREASQQFADKGKEQAEALSDKAADALEDVETVARVEADEFERLGWQNLSGYIREMADGIGNLSDELRHKSVDELLRSASDLARRNTGLFLLGSVAIGFGLSRIAKAAPAERGADAMRGATNSSDSENYSYPAGENRSLYASFACDDYRPPESH